MKILDPHVPLGDVIDLHGVPTDTSFPTPTKDNHELDSATDEISTEERALLEELDSLNKLLEQPLHVPHSRYDTLATTSSYVTFNSARCGLSS